MKLLTDYAKVRAAIAKLEEKKKDLEEQIKEEIGNEDITVKTNHGTIYTSRRTYYTYTDPEIKEAITEHKNEITRLQEEAKQSGKVEVKETLSIGYRHASD